MALYKSFTYLFYLLALLLVSCSSPKKLAQLQQKNNEYEAKIKRLQSDSAHLSWKVDSLRKHIVTAQAQKNALAMMNEKESKKSMRIRAEAEHYKQISLFIYNITKYVNWPAKENHPFTIVVIGNEALFNEITSQFNGKKIGNRPVLIRRSNSPKDIGEAEVYFISHQRLGSLSNVYKNNKNSRALVLSDHHQPTTGVHVSFFLEGDSLKFDLNEDEIKKSNIIMSSSLKSMQN